MKKTISLLLAVLLALLPVACGGSGTGGTTPDVPPDTTPEQTPDITPNTTLKEGVTLQSLAGEIAEKYEMVSFMEMGPEDLATLLEMDPGTMSDAYGLIAMMNVSADHFIAVKATEGSTATVQKALQDRLEFEQQSFSQYLPGVYEKTMQGKVLTIGDYVFLYILGRDDVDYGEESAAIESDIRAAFNG